MIILFFSRFFYPHIGGVEKHVLEISRRLAKKGHQVMVLTEALGDNRFNDLNHLKKERIGGIGVIRMRVGKDDFFKKFRIWWWLWQNRQLMSGADIIHCHDALFWYLPFRFLYPKKPVFVTFHGYETKFPPSKRAIFMRKFAEKLSWGNICVGEYLKKWYGTNANYITYGGVNIAQKSHLRPFDFAQGFGGQAKLKILFIGRLEKDTGIPIYLKALEILKNKGIEFEFEACGDGSLRKAVEKWGRVWGFVSNLTPYLTKSDLVFSSSYLSILEALSRNKVVFAVYENPLKRDYLKMTPFAKWIIIENNAGRLAKKIIDFLNNHSLRDKKITPGWRWAKKQTWDEVVKLYLHLWKI